MPQRDPFKEIEELFERFGKPSDLGGLSMSSISVDLADQGDELVLVADLPGFDQDDISVTVNDRTVTLSAERDRSLDVEDQSYVHRERSHQEQRRQVSLPADVDETAATATYNNGVLTVRLPKRNADEEGHSIDVE